MKPNRKIETLFTEARPRERGFKKHAEEDFEYMNLHIDAPVIAAREMMESWYQHFPADRRKDLVSRFRKKNQKQHAGAFWELYLHELFLRMGYSVDVHPNLLDSKSHPDFLLMKNGVPFALVEARLVGLPTDEKTSANRLERELYDALDRIFSPNFFLQVHQIRTSAHRPSFRQLTRDVERWLEKLDPDMPAEKFLSERNARMRFTWEESGWSLSLQVIPKLKEHRGKIGARSLGMFSTETEWSNTKSELRHALSEKAAKYGDFNLPFIIAINYMGMHCDQIDWIDVLYGTPRTNIRFAEDGTYVQEPFRDNDGFWMRAGQSFHEHVSAVIAGSQINPWSMGAHPLEVYAHFSAEHPVDFNGYLPCWQVSTSEAQLVSQWGRSSAEILGIPEGWPGKWDMPTSHAY